MHMLAIMGQLLPHFQFWAKRGVRARVTILSVTVVFVALLIGAIGFVFMLSNQLTHSYEQSVMQRAQDVAAQVKSDDADAARAVVVASPGDTTLVQVIDASGKVLYASPSIVGESAITAPLVVGSAPATQQLNLPFVDNASYLVATVNVTSPTGVVTVITAQTLAAVTRINQLLSVALLIAAPLGLAVVGSVVWIAVGSSLASVDRIRRRVETIDGAGLTGRVPVPLAKDEVERLAITMNHMLDRLEQTNLNQRRFLADASHELKSPLASMRATIDVAARSPRGMDGEMQGFLSEEVDRMSQLVHDLLLLARADEGSPQLRLSDVDIDDIVMGEVRRLEAQHTLTIIADVEAARLRGDRTAVGQAIRNVVDNAARFAKGQIRFTVLNEQGFIVVQVEDDGPGIPIESREIALERFVRLDEHRSRNEGGSGLGLAIVQEITHIHHGNVVLEQSPLGGAQVTMRFASDKAATIGSSL